MIDETIINENVSYWRREVRTSLRGERHSRWALEEARDSSQYATVDALRNRYIELVNAIKALEPEFGDKVMPLRYRLMANKRLGIIASEINNNIT